MNGRHFSGKTYHESSLYSPYVGTKTVMRRLASECQLLSQVHHSNLVEFFGICFFQERVPTFVMELMYYNLESFMKSTGVIPLQVNLHILHEIAKGLKFLHTSTPPLVHGDLTSNNILLSKDAAVVKISDFRSIQIVDPEKANEFIQKNSVVSTYMPPEAIRIPPQFGLPVDIFSFGHLALCTLLKVFPENLPPKSCSEVSMKLVHTELERRKGSLDILKDMMPAQSPIVKVIERCLEDSSLMRYIISFTKIICKHI